MDNLGYITHKITANHVKLVLKKNQNLKESLKKLETFFFSKFRKNSQLSLGSFHFFVRSQSANALFICAIKFQINDSEVDFS